jgi:N-acetylglutamate synthase-like GNAT family acetyltransferase
MSPSNLQARRATVDDLVELRKLWRGDRLPVSALEKQLKDFQIVETPDGILLGAIALQIEGQQGRLHSEGCVKPEFEAEIRQRLWERVQTVARNHGLHRVWTDDESPCWRPRGFEPASPDLQKHLPASLGEPSRPWLVLKLREAVPESISLEHEFELFSRAQRESTDRTIRQVQTIKNIAYAMLIAVVVIGLALAVFAVLPGGGRARPVKPKRPPSRLEQSSSP